MHLETPIIGVTGRAGAGKDTVCNMAVDLLQQQNKRARRIACADPLKDICTEVFGRAYNIHSSHFWGSQDQKNEDLEALPGWSGRKILQHVGTAGFRHVHAPVWGLLMHARALHLLHAEQMTAVFVSDIRMHTEADLIHRSEGIIIRVLRPEADDGETQGLKGHITEQEQSSIKEDFVINNEGRPLPLLEGLVERQLIELGLLDK